ncbi:hypothetical protein IFM89_014279 [Coptis chinensis]|uniref:Uncharacterized protein n=1 Tax=Coptis chinensis TaxID=261450 RepID=A0A835H682_9MAGN|nr:hypothetical protein IFM89_014279 [Coptis chinensis]
MHGHIYWLSIYFLFDVMHFTEATLHQHFSYVELTLCTSAFGELIGHVDRVEAISELQCVGDKVVLMAKQPDEIVYHFYQLEGGLIEILGRSHTISNLNEGINGNKTHERKQVSKVSTIATFEQFILHDFDASDGASSFPVAAVHRAGILDINQNLLVRKLHGVGVFGQ